VSAFDYLAVLLSIVLGLGITQLLTGFASLARARDRTRVYWPALMQMAVVFLIHVQVWWALFGLRGIAHWTFAQFLVVLMQPVTVYMMAAFITPEVSAEGAVDLRGAYFREHRWFFGALVAALLVSLCKNFVLYQRLPHPVDLAGHAVFLVAALTGMISSSDRVHKILAPVSLVIYASYIALLFVQLPG
jgi:hypothetical protein